MEHTSLLEQTVVQDNFDMILTRSLDWIPWCVTIFSKERRQIAVDLLESCLHNAQSVSDVYKKRAEYIHSLRKEDRPYRPRYKRLKRVLTKLGLENGNGVQDDQYPVQSPAP